MSCSRRNACDARGRHGRARTSERARVWVGACVHGGVSQQLSGQLRSERGRARKGGGSVWRDDGLGRGSTLSTHRARAPRARHAGSAAAREAKAGGVAWRGRKGLGGGEAGRGTGRGVARLPVAGAHAEQTLDARRDALERPLPRALAQCLRANRGAKTGIDSVINSEMSPR
eukprot:3925992-Pleurochrysis_carterae.AAC.2